ncbi:MAG: hypothetical protein IH613_03675 [Desulfuromonadales bacterium]|nr:hypothetical protein [Desulfuromonadales bacterium]
MNKHYPKYIIFVFTSLLLWTLSLAPNVVAATLQQSQRGGTQWLLKFQYLLSDFSGPVPSQWARLAFDPERREIYTLNPSVNDVKIFNPQGMELFSFGNDGDLVSAVDIAVGDDGNIYALARDFHTYGIQVLNYRGEPISKIAIKDSPEQFSGFSPDRMEYQGGLFYLLDSGSLRIVTTSADGTFIQGHDLAAIINHLEDEQAKENPERERDKAQLIDISGFSVGPDKSLYFTVPLLFSAFRLNTDGSLDSFGTSGSAPGKFGVVSGIVADNQGNIFVADRLRSVVMIFDSNFNFLGEFGYRGYRPEDMIVPDDLALDQASNRIFVSQASNKGVGVYTVVLLPSP